MISPPKIQCFVKQAKPVERRVAKLLYDKLSALPTEELQKVQTKLQSSGRFPDLYRNSGTVLSTIKDESYWSKLYRGQKALQADNAVDLVSARADVLGYLRALAEGKAYPHFQYGIGNTHNLSNKLVDDMRSLLFEGYAALTPSFKPASPSDVIPKATNAVSKAKHIIKNVKTDDVTLRRLSEKYGVPVESMKGVLRQTNAEPFGKLLFTPHLADPTLNLAYEYGKRGPYSSKIKNVLDDFLDVAIRSERANAELAQVAGAGGKDAEREFLKNNRNFRIVDSRHFPKKYVDDTTTASNGGRYSGAFYETVMPQAYNPILDKATQRVFVLTTSKPSAGRVLTVDDLASKTAGKPLLFKGQGFAGGFRYDFAKATLQKRKRHGTGAGWWFTPNPKSGANYAGMVPDESTKTYLLPVPTGTDIQDRKHYVHNILYDHLKKRGQTLL